MKKLIAVLAVASMIGGVATGASYSAPAMKKMAAMKCPACGMSMPTHKTAMMTVPVKIKGVTYYCCSMCKAGKAAAAANKKKKM